MTILCNVVAHALTDNFLTVSPENQPPSSTLRAGFSISAWVQPVTQGSYFIVAKTTSDGSRFFYTLKLVVGVQNILLFGFSQLGENVSSRSIDRYVSSHSIDRLCEKM